MRCAVFYLPVLALSGACSFGDELISMGRELYPENLVPVRSFMDGLHADYDQLLAEHLFVTTGRLGRMLVRPSFSTEFCLAVDVQHIEPPSPRQASSAPAEDPFVPPDSHRRQPENTPARPAIPPESPGEDRYSITVTAAAQSIWRARWEAEKNATPVHVAVQRVNRAIGRDLAVAIQRVWAKALLLTRYPRPTDGSMEGTKDGTTYQFSVFLGGFGVLEGQTHSPQRGLPRDLMNLGLDLVAFARQDAKAKNITEEQLVNRLRVLETTIPKP